MMDAKAYRSLSELIELILIKSEPRIKSGADYSDITSKIIGCVRKVHAISENKGLKPLVMITHITRLTVISVFRLRAL